MGWRTRLLGGDEWDILTRARRFLRFRPSFVKAVKRKHNKRVRKMAKREIEQ